MKLTILFDLDDTLLKNSMGNFLPAYFHSLSSHLNHLVPVEKVPEGILKGTEVMMTQASPLKTLEENFDGFFYPYLGLKKADLHQTIVDFYENKFPSLREKTQQINGIPSLMKKLLADGNKIIIATNPLFPKRAVEHRLAWAGLSPSEFNFDLITSFENFHFAKPDPAFIAEALAQIGWPDYPVVFIGNDWEMDIKPAEILGIPTFYLGKPLNNQEGRHSLSTNGDHDDITNWIDSVSSNLQQFECRNDPKAYFAILKSTPAALSTILKKIENPLIWKFRPKEQEWSLVEIISHLADVDKEVNLKRIRQVKSEEKPFFSAALTDDWAKTKNYQANGPYESFSECLLSRQELLEELSSLKDEEWHKKVSHAIFGPTTILEMVKFIAQHDRLHIQQVVNTLQEAKLSLNQEIK